MCNGLYNFFPIVNTYTKQRKKSQSPVKNHHFAPNHGEDIGRENGKSYFNMPYLATKNFIEIHFGMCVLL